MSRYDRRDFVEVDLKEDPSNMHKGLLQKRGLKRLSFYMSPKFLAPSYRDIQNIRYTIHIWKTGDRFSKLAALNYGDAAMWWVIAYFNKRPTDGHVRVGDRILIPEDISIIRDLVAG